LTVSKGSEETIEAQVQKPKSRMVGNSEVATAMTDATTAGTVRRELLALQTDSAYRRETHGLLKL
jgi:hypothetical protein